MSLTASLRCAEILDTIRAGLWYTHTEMENIPYYIPSGGAFPIRVHYEWVATLVLSGLHEGRDHELIVRALSRALEKQVSVFPSAAI
ncbi:heme-binding protein [Paenibacillus tundrae]